MCRRKVFLYKCNHRVAGEIELCSAGRRAVRHSEGCWQVLGRWITGHTAPRHCGCLVVRGGEPERVDRRCEACAQKRTRSYRRGEQERGLWHHEEAHSRPRRHGDEGRYGSSPGRRTRDVNAVEAELTQTQHSAARNRTDSASRAGLPAPPPRVMTREVPQPRRTQWSPPGPPPNRPLPPLPAEGPSRVPQPRSQHQQRSPSQPRQHSSSRRAEATASSSRSRRDGTSTTRKHSSPRHRAGEGSASDRRLPEGYPDVIGTLPPIAMAAAMAEIAQATRPPARPAAQTGPRAGSHRQPDTSPRRRSNPTSQKSFATPTAIATPSSSTSSNPSRRGAVSWSQVSLTVGPGPTTSDSAPSTRHSAPALPVYAQPRLGDDEAAAAAAAARAAEEARKKAPPTLKQVIKKEVFQRLSGRPPTPSEASFACADARRVESRPDW